MDFVHKLKEFEPVSIVLIGFGTFITLCYGILSWPFLIFIACPVLFKIYLKLSIGKTSSSQRLDGKVVIVTGANAGLGFETAKELARRNAKVILACRNLNKGKVAMEQIVKETGNQTISLMELDVGSLKSVREFCKKFISEQTRLDVLVNNAGGAIQEKIITSDGHESNFAANHFGPFLLTNILLDLMRKTGNSRIVMVSSNLHKLARSFDLDNLNSEKSFGGLGLYPRTKLANVLMTREMNRRFRAAGITEVTINACTPGFTATELLKSSNEIKWRAWLNRAREIFARTVWEGAQCQIHLAVAHEVEELSGLFWADCAESSISTLAQNTKLAKDLWEKSIQATGLSPSESIIYSVFQKS